MHPKPDTMEDPQRAKNRRRARNMRRANARKRRWAREKAKATSSLTRCAICLEDICTDDAIVSQQDTCMHTFHSSCYDELLRWRHYQCPICRVPFPSHDVVRAYWRRKGFKLPEDDLFAWNTTAKLSPLQRLMCALVPLMPPDMTFPELLEVASTTIAMLRLMD